jgi:ribonucleoside-diphosphate reductase beta chain
VFTEVGNELGEEVLPGFQAGITDVRKDEGRHIANGRWMMKKLAEEDPDIVTEVYEPKIDEYLERLTGQQTDQDESAYSFDMQELQRRVANDNLRQTIEVIGEDKFERYDASVDIQAAQGAASADD